MHYSNFSNKQYRQKVYESNFNQSLQGVLIDEFTPFVDKCVDESSINFLSEWFFDEQIIQYNPFFYRSLSAVLNEENLPIQYVFPDTNTALNENIKRFHCLESGNSHDSFDVFISEGSTPLISSIVLLIKEMGFSNIYSISPLYFTIHKICDLLGIEIAVINQELTYSRNIPNQELFLPHQKTVLFITDPIWSIGRHHSKKLFEYLLEWQQQTHSLIFVDGSFSYMDWYTQEKQEPACILDPNLTIRLVCPTKALCLHGIRFSYLLCPKSLAREVARITIANNGSSCFFSHLTRQLLFQEMISSKISHTGLFARNRFEILKEKLDKNGIEYIVPKCGFFMYVDLDTFLVKNKLRQYYAWLPKEALDIMFPRYNGYAKLNLIGRHNTFFSLIKDLEC